MLSATKELASRVFAEAHGHNLQGWIDARRAEGISWRRIARDLATITDGEVSVTHQTLVNWSTSKAAA